MAQQATNKKPLSASQISDILGDKGYKTIKQFGDLKITVRPGQDPTDDYKDNFELPCYIILQGRDFKGTKQTLKIEALHFEGILQHVEKKPKLRDVIKQGARKEKEKIDEMHNMEI